MKMDDAISRKGTSAWLENMGYSYPAKVIMDEKRFPSVLSTNLAEVGTDCISRQAAIDALHMDTSIIPFEKAREYADATISEIRNRLEKLPSAQPKRGRWIHDGSKWTNRWICSECGYKWFFDCIEGAFCPHCGADMREVTE